MGSNLFFTNELNDQNICVRIALSLTHLSSQAPGLQVVGPEARRTNHNAVNQQGDSSLIWTNPEAKSKMFLEVQLPSNVIVPAENLDSKGLALQKAMMIRLLEEFAAKRPTEDLGYYLAVTTLDSIGEGKVRQCSGDVLFPVVLSCITFKIFRGEILEGVVYNVLKKGVFLRCGPIERIFLSSKKMADYHYVPGENPFFLSENMSKIEKDGVIRFVVIATEWLKEEKEFRSLASLEGDYLGPVS